MRKRLPMSALITGLLAAPVLGATGFSTPGSAAPIVERWVETFPAEMPAEVGERMRRIARGEKLSAFGMQGLQARIMRRARERVAQFLSGNQAAAVGMEQAFVPAQWNISTPMEFIPSHKEKIAFLGVAPSPVPESLAVQLNLARGMGLVVDFVEPDSPADKAGLKKNDVLQKLDDQWLINAQQMQVLVRARKAGDSVTFTLFRGGKPTEVKVTLTEREVVVADQVPGVGGSGVGGGGGQAVNYGSWADASTDGVTRHFSGSSVIVNADGSVTRTFTDDDNVISAMRDKDGHTIVLVKDRDEHVLYQGPTEGMDKSLPAPLARKVSDAMAQPNEVRIEVHGSDTGAGTKTAKTFTISRSDKAHEINVDVTAAGRHVTVKELATGKMLYEGPANADSDLKDLPVPVQEKVKAVLEKVK